MTDPSAIDRPAGERVPIVINITATRVLIGMIAGPLVFCLYCLLWGAMP